MSVVQTDPSRRRKRRSGALLAGEAERAVDQAIDEPFEPHGHFDELAAELRGDAVDDAAADDGLADGAAAAPVGTILVQIRNGGREVMIGIHQAVRAGDDAVPVGVGVVGEGDVEFVAHADQPRHRIGRRAIHPDLAVPIDRHEAKRRVDRVADDGRGHAIALDDRLPEMDAGAAQRIDPDLHPGGADRLHVDDVGEVGDIGADVVVAMDAGRFARAVVRDSSHAIEIVFEKRVCGALDPGCYVGIGRSAIRRVVLEAAVLGRIMRRGDDDPVGETALAVLVVGQDRVRNDGRRRVAVALVDHHIDVVGGKYLERACQGGFGQRVRVDADEQRAGDAASAPVMTDRLADRQDMRLIEGVVEGGAAMTRRAERHALRRDRRVRFAGEIRCHQPRHIDQHRWLDRLAGERT